MTPTALVALPQCIDLTIDKQHHMPVSLPASPHYVTQVTNTPWGERVTFMFNPAGDASPKALHVSPFMDMDNTWHLKASPPPFLPGGAATAAADDADAVPGDGSRGNEGDKMQHASLSVSVLVTHPRLGAYFDAHLLLRRCPDDQQCLPEQGGLTALLRWGCCCCCCLLTRSLWHAKTRSCMPVSVFVAPGDEISDTTCT